MQKTDLAELRRLWEETTPGEWALAWEDGKTGVLASMIGKLVAFIGNPDPSDGYEPTRKANGEFIAAAHNALPALLDEIEAARKEMRRQGSVIWELRQELRQLFEQQRHTKLLGAAEWLEEFAGDADGSIHITHAWLRERAAKLRQEAEGK